LMVETSAPDAPSNSIRLKLVAPMSPYTPTYCEPLGFHDSKMLGPGCAKGTMGARRATSSSRMRPSFWPPASATIFLPSLDSAWQPTQVPPVSEVSRNLSAMICVDDAKSNRMMPVSLEVVQ